MGTQDTAMHCRTNTRGFETDWTWVMGEDWSGVSGSVRVSSLRTSPRRCCSRTHTRGGNKKKKKAVGLHGADCSRKHAYWAPGRAREWHVGAECDTLSWALTERRLAVLTALTMGHSGRGDKAGVLSVDVSVLTVTSRQGDRGTSKRLKALGLIFRRYCHYVN